MRVHTLFLALSCLLPSSALAFTTRVHIALANDVIDALNRSEDGRIELKLGGGQVQLAEVDAQAIRAAPLAFRAGAIGPDNFVFPAMTDLTHAVGFRPYDQCADLLGMATNDTERAYALGCLLHGSTDAVAHHYVNWLTGETFTLAPITHGRQDSLDNVVRHIVAESMVQDAMLAARPDVFSADKMLHAIPDDFVLRAMVSIDSPAWQRMAGDAVSRLESTKDANPGALLADLVTLTELTPAEQIVLLPVYLDLLSVDLSRIGEGVDALVTDLQDRGTADGAELRVTAGPDGTLGTRDDVTACDLSCPTLYVLYFGGVALLEPAPGGSGEPAWTDLVRDLEDDLTELPAAYVQTVGGLSAALTGPLATDSDALDVTDAQIETALAPLRNWSDDAVDLDLDFLVEGLAPQWLLDVREFLASFGIVVDLGAAAETLVQPLIDEINETIETRVLAVAEEYIDQIVTALEEDQDAVKAEFQARLEDAAPAGLDGTLLDHLPDSGLYGSAFNIAAAAIANPELMLPVGDEWAGLGPASFDASYTLAWSQVAVCPGLSESIFPLGYDIDGLLSARVDGVDLVANVDGEAPIECHDGSLDRFTDQPDVNTCALVSLPELVADPVGSVSRSFPPGAVGAGLTCVGLVVPGLDVDVDDGADGGRGCGCGSTPTAPGGVWLLALALLVACKRDGGPGPTGDGEPAGPSASTPPAPVDGELPELLADLDGTSWHARLPRFGAGRDVQLDFRADGGVWVETVNPWGPGRHRELRTMLAFAGSDEVTTLVSVPEGWPVDDEEGRVDRWVLDLLGETLAVERGGEVEIFDAGPVPAPQGGLTAHVRAFEPNGVVDEAFCDATLGGIDYVTLFDFARGGVPLDWIAEDAVAGVDLGGWPATSNFAIRDVPGFDRNGGTTLDIDDNFVVTYTGALEHPGGTLSIREQNDAVEDGVWVFLDDEVGGATNDLFLEVHGLAYADKTPDEPSRSFPAGEVPIEAMLIRCDQALVRVDVEVRMGGGWTSIANVSTVPELDDRFGPPF